MSFAIPYCNEELLFSQMRDMKKNNKMRYEVQWHGYENAKQVIKHHGIFNTLEEAQDSVREWWKKNNFKPYYVRSVVLDDGTVWWDYGSHICFYYFVPIEE